MSESDGNGGASAVHEPARDTPVLTRADVLVVGGGSAGVCAAVAAAMLFSNSFTCCPLDWLSR